MPRQESRRQEFGRPHPETAFHLSSSTHRWACQTYTSAERFGYRARVWKRQRSQPESTREQISALFQFIKGLIFILYELPNQYRSLDKQVDAIGGLHIPGVPSAASSIGTGSINGPTSTTSSCVEKEQAEDTSMGSFVVPTSISEILARARHNLNASRSGRATST